jgi:hypothetical protein
MPTFFLRLMEAQTKVSTSSKLVELLRPKNASASAAKVSTVRSASPSLGGAAAPGAAADPGVSSGMILNPLFSGSVSSGGAPVGATKSLDEAKQEIWDTFNDIEALLNTLDDKDGDYDVALEELVKRTKTQDEVDAKANELREAMKAVIQQLNKIKAVIVANRPIIQKGGEDDKQQIKETMDGITDIETNKVEAIIEKHKIVLKGFTKDSVPVATAAVPNAFGPLASSLQRTVSPRRQSGGRRTKKKGKGRLTKKANGKGRKTRKAKARK